MISMIKNWLILILILIISSGTYAQNISITHGPYLQAAGTGEVTVVWTTDKDAVSWVEIAPDDEKSFYAEERPQFFQTKNGKKVVGRLHKVRITGLKEGTSYRYRVFSKEVLNYEGYRMLYGHIASTKVSTANTLRFTTLDTRKEEISFLVLNDIHSRVDDLSALSKHVEYGKTDLVIFNGDMVSSMNNEEQFFQGFMDAATTKFAGNVPVFYCRGNHETRGAFSVNFPDYFPTSSGNLYYSFRQGPAFFIFLDGGEDKPDSDIEYSGLADFDSYRTEQQKWLENVMQSEDFKSAPYKMVILHIPPVESTWHGPLDIRKKFLPALNGKGITAMFCGHIHRFRKVDSDPSLHDFPILINAHTSSFEVKAGPQKVTVLRKDTDGKILDTITF